MSNDSGFPKLITLVLNAQLLQWQSVTLATSPKPLSSKISFSLEGVPVHLFLCALPRIMGKILFCLVTENVYGTDCK